MDGLLLGQTFALAVAAGPCTAIAGPGRIQSPAALARLNQMVGDDFQIPEAMACEHMANRIVNAVADDLHLDTMQPGLGHEAGKVLIDLDAVQMVLQLDLAHVQQGHLPLHALARADIATLPGVLQLLPARPAKAIEQGISHVQQADGAVEIALHHPAGRSCTCRRRANLNELIHGN